MSDNKSNKFILVFIIKIIASTVLSLIGLTYIFSYVIYKLDLSLESAEIISVFTVALSAFIISMISVWGIRNNGVFAGILSQLPLIIYSLFNMIFNDNSPVLFAVKAVISILIGMLIGYAISNKRKRYKL